MHKYFGYDSFMATYQNGEYPNLKFLPGVRVEFIPRITGDFVKDACVWLRENSNRIDVIYSFHFGKRTYKFIREFEKHNKNGKIYVELDGWQTAPKKYKLLKPRNLVNYFRNLYILRNAFVVTEFNENVEKLSKSWHHKIGCVPNPINPDEIKEFKNFTERENIIFTSGRLGTHQKATEILLNAFTKICDKIPNWKLKLAGKFRENINIADEFFKAHPELKDRVIFAGMINDREQLINMYRESKIFAFPSRFESFGIALSEAMSQGCFPIVSNIPSSRFLTENFKFAYYHEVDDVNTLAEKLLYACTHENEIENLAREGQKAIIKRCNLEKCCKTIQKGLNLNS